jgi:hypothetical protein
MEHPLGKKVPGCGKQVVDGLFSLTFGRAQEHWKRFLNSAEKYGVHRLSLFRFVGPGQKKGFSTTRHGDGKCLPRKVYNSRKEKLSTAFHASYATGGSS